VNFFDSTKEKGKKSLGFRQVVNKLLKWALTAQGRVW
jgi:hypothetical protein